MTVEDREDYEEVVTIKGTDGTDLVTVKLDVNGNMIGVFKGDYEGTLETIKLDKSHRMLARSIQSVETILLGGAHDAVPASGNLYLYVNAVPPEKRHKYTALSCYNEAGFSEAISIGMESEGDHYPIANRRSIPPKFSVEWNGEVWVAPGDRAYIYVEGATEYDEIWLFWHGAEFELEY